MLDHVFTDAIGALRENLEDNRLEPLTDEERFLSDVLLGDLTWQTSYGLWGETNPPRVQADITLEWPTWAQSSYRSWCREEEIADPPVINIEIVLRVQRLAEPPDVSSFLQVLPEQSTLVGGHALERTGPRVEIGYDEDLEGAEHAIEIGYEGVYELDEGTLAKPDLLDDHFASMGGWISSVLVRLGDLKLNYLPPEEDEPA